MRKSLLLLLAAFPAANAFAADAVLLTGGTLGPGISLSVPTALPKLAVRFSANAWRDTLHGLYASNGNQLLYSAQLHLQTQSVLLDYRPWTDGFRVSAGLMHDQDEIVAQGMPDSQGNYVISGETYPSGSIGALSATVSVHPWVPYLGLGWSLVLDDAPGLVVSWDLGLMFQGHPEVHLVASGNDPAVAAAVASAEVSMQNELNRYRYYPVAGLSVGYQF